MTRSIKFVAFDLGAESGRAMVGAFDGVRVSLDEAFRFANVPVRTLDSLHWDALRLFDDIRRGLAKIAQAQRDEIASVGLDTWGVDFALLGRDDELLGNPFHYRDARTNGMLDKAFQTVSRAEIFEQTGVQFLQINTLYQLLAMKGQNAPALENAKTFLMMPDLFNFWLTGTKACEFSNATTTQFYNPRTRAWARELFETLNLPYPMLPNIVPPGTILGNLHASVADEVNLPNIPVVAPATHDTGSAAAAVPAENDAYAWISSGTWSVMGANVPDAIVNADSLKYNFTNEGGADRTFRFSKNVLGLWIVQECRRTWARAGHEYSYDELVEMARRAPAFQSLIDPDASEFLAPGDMPARIAAYCERTAQPVPQEPASFVRCALESLALKYRYNLDRLEMMLGRRMSCIHIVGGGTQNKLLCQFTANATGQVVHAGPVEATAVGNILLQAVALGQLDSLADARRVIRNSFEIATYEPRDLPQWQDANARFSNLLASSVAV